MSLEAFRQQAGWCRQLGSPLTALLMEVLAARLDRSTAVGRRVLDWPGLADTSNDAVPLRVAGGLHALVRRGAAPGLAAVYPPHDLPDAEGLWGALAPVLADPALEGWLDSAPQTNEVARSGVLMPGLMVVAAETGLPVALYELGSSAGLNLMLDRYGYRLGHSMAGDGGSALVLAPEWRGAAAPSGAVRVVRRRGVDLNPLDVTRAADRERLLAYIWADQPARLARVAAAIAIAATDPPTVDRGDAADWVERWVDMAPESGVARVVMHSIAFQYFPAAVQARIVAHLADVGGRATVGAPLVWLRLEVDPAVGGGPALALTMWPGGEERMLARASAHGVWVEWMGG